MYVARLTCSDPECAAESLQEGSTPVELERLMCECGCALEVIGWPDWVEQPAAVVALRTRPGALSTPLHEAA